MNESFIPAPATQEKLVEKEGAQKGREHHLRLDEMTGMRKKELLFLPEGIAYLKEKFGDEMQISLGDIAGMGVGNDMLRRPGEPTASAKKNVDDCFILLNSVALEIYGNDIDHRLFEIVRVGGDEIIFITKKGDDRLRFLFRRFNEEKEKLLVDRIGREAYDAAKLETNIKAQMKLITKEPRYLELVEKGDVKAVDTWLHEQLGSMAASELRTGELLKSLARLRMDSIPEEEWLVPLDFYRSSEKNIARQNDPLQVRQSLMTGVAAADADIGWLKGHPGLRLPDGTRHEENAIENTAGKYLEQAMNVEKNIRLIQEKERKLSTMRGRQEHLEEERLKKEIIRLETIDPGTGAIRLDKSESKHLIDLIELTEAASGLEVTRLDIPYFGVYNNHYDYATADEMMKRLVETFRRFMQAAVVRDGGSLYALRIQAGGENRDPAALKEALNAILIEYSQPDDPKKKLAMENEVLVKKAITRQNDQFGRVKLSQPVEFTDVSHDTRLSDVVRIAL